jgi:two-component system phosphate regulon sensor histidine kinase PhoR
MTGREFSDSLRKIEWRVDIPLRWVLLVLGGITMGSLRAQAFSIGILGGLLLYAVSNVALMLVFLRRRLPTPVTKGTLVCSYITDVVFVSFLVYYTGGIGSDMYLLYCLLVFKAAVYYPYLRSMIFIAFLFCPLYVYVLYLGFHSLFFLLEKVFLFRYLLLIGTVCIGMYTAWLMDSRQQRIQILYESLAEEKRLTDERMRQIMAVNEVAKALVSTLDIEKALQLVVDVLASIFGIGRCAVALLDEEKGELIGGFGRGISEEEIRALRISLDDKNAILTLALRKGYPIVAIKGKQGESLTRPWMPSRLSGDSDLCLAAPLIAKEQPMGVIYLEASSEIFGEEQLSLTTSFAHFAALALENAQLYRRIDEKRRELEAILCSIGDAVIVMDGQRNLIMINPVASEIFETTASTAIGQPLSEVIGDGGLISLLEKALEGHDDSSFSQEVVLCSAENGREMVYEALASPLAGAGDGGHGAVVVLRNVTKQKELELMKSDFVSIVSHELKTPLHSIRGFVDVILMGKTGELNELQRDFLETTLDQTKYLQSMINDLLDFTQLESGRISLTLQEVSIAELVGEVITRLEPLANEAGIMLCKVIAPGLPSIQADRTRLLQVLTNLVENAIKFTPTGGKISLEALDNVTQVQVRVSDTGIGITPGEREKIFNRFYQIDSSSTRAYRGTGLGLAICKYIIEAHRGRIWVESNEPQGSVFCFTVPKYLENRKGLALDFSRIQS